MSKLDALRLKINKGEFPNIHSEFGGADLIITSNHTRKYRAGNTIIYSEHAAALSWLVIQLKNAYSDELNYSTKFDFYPSIGEVIKNTLIKQELIFESMLTVIDQIEISWGSK